LQRCHNSDARVAHEYVDRAKFGDSLRHTSLHCLTGHVQADPNCILRA
jgi:hypothetical protein